MAPRTVSIVFQQYQIARLQFATSCADLSAKPEHVDSLIQENVIVLLRNLLTDVAPAIQLNAVIAMGNLAAASPTIAELLIKHDIVRILLYFNMDKSNKYLKRAALNTLRSVVKHSAELAKSVIDIGGLDQVVAALEDFDPGVKEAAAWVLGHMARHDVKLAYHVIAAGAVALLILGLQEPEVKVRTIAACALSDICKHSPETAQAVIDSGAIAHLVRAVGNVDPKLKRQALNALASVAKHSLDMTEVIIEADVIKLALESSGHTDAFVRKAACGLIREIVKHSPETAQLVVEAGGLGVLVSAVSKNKGDARLPGIMALGFISGFSPEMALSVVYSQGVEALALAFEEEKEKDSNVAAAAAWSLGHVARHSADHAKHVCATGLIPKIVDIYMCRTSSAEMKDKAKQALKMIIFRCEGLDELEPLLEIAPPKILKYIVAQFSKILPKDPAARRAFVTSGGLRKMQELLNTDSAPEGSVLREHIQIINQSFPEDVVKYFSPEYPQTLLDRVEQFKPMMNIDPALWSERLFSDTRIPVEIKEEILALQKSLQVGGSGEDVGDANSELPKTPSMLQAGDTRKQSSKDAKLPEKTPSKILQEEPKKAEKKKGKTKGKKSASEVVETSESEAERKPDKSKSAEPEGDAEGEKKPKKSKKGSKGAVKD